MANEIVIDISAKVDNIEKSLNSVTQQAEKTAKNIDSIKWFTGVTASIEIAKLAMGGLGKAVEGVKAILDASFKAEDIIAINKQFEILTQRAGLAGETLQSALKAAGDGLIDDTDLLQAANKALIDLGSSASKLPEILTLARQATSVFGGSVVQNFEAMNQAIATGNTRALKQLGIVIDSDAAYKRYAQSIGVSVNSLNEQGRSQAILNALLEKGSAAFAGVNANLKENTNAFIRLKVTLNDFLETIALAFNKTFGPLINNALSLFSNTLDQITTKLKASFSSGVDQSQAKVKDLTNQLQQANQELLRLENLPAGTAGPMIEQQKNRIRDLQGALAQATTSMQALQTTSETAAPKIGAAISSNFDPQRLQQDQDKFMSKLAEMNMQRINSQLGVATSEEQIQQLSNEKIQLIAQQHNARIAETTRMAQEAGLLDSQAYTESMKALEEQRWAEIEQVQMQSQARNLERAKAFNQGLNSGLANTISSGIQAFVKGLAKGEDAFGAFVKAVLSSLGDMAISMGGILIASGLGIEALKSLTGGAAIAAGIALIALGALAKVIAGAGGGGETAGASGSGGGVASQPSSLTEQGQVEQTKPGTTVNVNVQGNILDRRQTGLEIAEIISESFDTQGSIIRGSFA